MYLKRISLNGFKSFPDRVDFDFSPGVTCIVGPNGCGKSNLVDAFKWVLGEQSSKSLRGRQMADMIFNGAASRRSSGLAQVDLYFDNADRSLPADHDEVVVTRKLYRSGESEYLINKDPVRLRDVRDLFLDTGVGADTYSVIEQGRVEVLLQASPIERRIIFEEAAGIAKYKVRKLEAQRKLDRTHQNLLRIDDIIAEVQRRLRSVKLQAGKARSFQVHQARLKELRAGYSIAEYHRLTLEVDTHRRQGDAASDEATALRTQIDRNEAEVVKLAARSNQLDEDRSVVERELMEARSEIAAQEERRRAAHRRRDEQVGNVERVNVRLEDLLNHQSELEAELAKIQELAVALQHETHERDAKTRELSEEDQRLGRELTQLEARLEDEKTGIIDLVRRSSEIGNEIANLDAQREALADQHGRLDERDAAIRRELEELMSRKAAYESRLSEIEGLIERESSELAQRRAEAERIEVTRGELSESLSDAKEQRSGLRSRLQVLDELRRKMEGVGAGVRAVLDAKRSNPEDRALGRVIGMVADLLEPDPAHATIIEAAIGECDQSLVITHSDALLKIQRRIGEWPGRMTAICMDRLPPLFGERDFSDQPGYVARAVDLIRCDEAYDRLARHLLGKTNVVDTLESALAMAADDVTGYRFVTPAGEVVEPSGLVSVGPPSTQAGLMARMGERRQVAVQLEDTETCIVSILEELNRAVAEAGHVDEVQQQLRTAIYEAQTAKVEASAALENVTEAIRRLGDEQPVVRDEVAAIEQQLAEARQRSTEGKQSIHQLDRESEARQQAVASYREQIEKLTYRRSEVQRALTEARVAVGQLTEKRAATAETINNVRRSQRKAADAVDVAIQEREDARSGVAGSEEIIEIASQRLAELQEASGQLEAKVLEVQRRREMVRLESEQLSAATKESRSALEEIEGRMHATQLAMQEAVVRRDDLTERVKEELELDLAEMYETYDPAEEDWEAVEAEIAELRRKIDRLGNVNLDAITEQEELEKRDNFLTAQRKDLEDSRRELESLIRKLDDESVDRFTRTFEEVRKNFNELFRKLFGGGKADIILEDPENVLECGIEIFAKPPGKELQRISLMSGGEKALTAIALVMSIFRSRPAPFAILDEVDASLDEANNVRFNTLVREFLDRSQFIIITHSKRTMSIADHLYGITMQEPGISTRVGVKFEQDQPTSQAVA